ncbi:oxygen-insensitive NAD(P)H nitroreductase [Duganella sp. FT80W]|uniref:Oxygen-insensitive NAD(P)H nitroreductase n=1 Tax=Duganella guangzhouensis TaxID=2666084 RepID=A0A6I2KSS5_9BURK|nr:oxygen-insensitive NAD(P)H nitroreductase [Duganella guangzhouensis]MRW88561.1 oxygen-insensitive NAD(P)H nitroreductase [Duganella guangzhouensis]
MNILAAALQRYAVKAYDPARFVPEQTMHQIYELLRCTPSSVNSQPWHFIASVTPEGKARLLKGVQGGFSFNEPKVRNASHVVLLCVRKGADPQHLRDVLEQEQREGRFVDELAQAAQDKARQGYFALRRDVHGDLPAWMEKQVYIALGTVLLGAAALGVDATPMEGIDKAALDAEFGLAAQGGASVAMVCFGYRSPDDANGRLPKSRLSQAQVFTFV